MKTVNIFMLLVLLLSCSGKKAVDNIDIEPIVQSKPAAEQAKTKEYTVKIIRQFPHNGESYTQGLMLYDGFLYESTGLKEHSTLQKLDINTGKLLQKVKLSDDYFAEGIAECKGKIYQLTWQDGTCFVYDAKKLQRIRNFSYFGEGWGLAYDGEKLFMSDGSFVIKMLNPDDFSLLGSKSISYENGRAVYDINELEFADGYLYANIWQEDRIVQIDTATSKVVGIIDISPLRDIVSKIGHSEVSNGIAYIPEKKTFILTGKYWQLFFEVEFVEKKR